MKNTIKSTNEISSLFKVAQRITTNSLIALVDERNEERGLCGRVAFIAGKRLGNAPGRNRAKRVMREAAREAGAPWKGFDVLFVARERTSTTPYQALLADMRHIERCLQHEQRGERQPTRRHGQQLPRRRARRRSADD